MRDDLRNLRRRTDLTEENFQFVLAERERCRKAGDDLGYAECLITLAHIVKWVRSDNDEPPFFRATSLSLEALPIFERLGNSEGTVSALLLASPMAGPEKGAEMLAQAMVLAQESGNDTVVARVLLRQAAAAGLSDKDRGIELNRQALAIYERLGDKGGQAACLFSLCIKLTGDPARAVALRGAELNREIGDLKEAAKCMSLALLFRPKELDLKTQQTYAEDGLADAQAAVDRSLEGVFYDHLARIHKARGNRAEATRYRRWAKEIKESDGLSPEERSRRQAEFAKSMVDVAKAMGNEKMEKIFKKRSK